MSDDESAPFWAPSVSVIGLGAAGTETVDSLTTETSATLTTVHGPDEASAIGSTTADADFLYLTGDVGESGVVDTAETVLDAADGHISFVVEGTTDRPAPIVEGCDFLLPVDPDAVSALEGRALVASTIADCFEAMLPPTVWELGHGDILATTGRSRIGSLHVQAPGGLRHVLPNRIDVPAPDSVLYFLCNDCLLDRPFVDRRGMDVSEAFPDAGTLWDQRIHDRYGDPAHAKLIRTVDADADRWARLLRP
mgnify:CR=1 FL=1